MHLNYSPSIISELFVKTLDRIFEHNMEGQDVLNDCVGVKMT